MAGPEERGAAELPPAIHEMVRRIVDSISPMRVILFGSYARGTAGPDSDVDLLVVTEVGGSRRQLSLSLRSRLGGLGLPKDVFVVTPEEYVRLSSIPGTIVRAAALEGRVLHERAA
jgi:predicted nucleotidyltransferase